MLSQIAALVQETSVTYASLGHTSSVSRCLSQPTRSRKVECRPRFLTVTIQWPNQTTYPLQIYDSGEDDFYSRAYLVKTSSSFRDIPFFTIIFGKCVPNINLAPSIIPPKTDAREKGKRRTPWASSKVVATCCFPTAAMEQWKQNLSYLPLYWLVHDGILMSYKFYNPSIIGWYHPLYKLHNLVAAQLWSHWKSVSPFSSDTSWWSGTICHRETGGFLHFQAFASVVSVEMSYSSMDLMTRV